MYSGSDSRRRQDSFPLRVELFGDDELGPSDSSRCTVLDAPVIHHLVARSALSHDASFRNALYRRDAGQLSAIDGVLIARA